MPNTFETAMVTIGLRPSGFVAYTMDKDNPTVEHVDIAPTSVDTIEAMVTVRRDARSWF